MEENTPTSNPEQHLKRFSPKTLILIGFLAVVAILLIFFALRMNNSTPAGSPTNGQSQIPPTSPVEKTATVAFSPQSVDLTTLTTATVDIIVTAGNTPITGAQVEINFDPRVVRNARVLPPDSTSSLFGAPSSFLELFNEVDNTNGTINYAIGIQPTGNPVVGAGSIGKLTFSVVKGVSPSTQITFGDATAVTVQESLESVLNSTTPLRITLQ